MKAPKIRVGDRIKFRAYKSAWPVTATNRFFTICAKKLTGALAKHQFIYTIIEWAEDRRAPDSLIFGPLLNYAEPKDAAKGLRQLGTGKMTRVRYCGRLVWKENELSISSRRAVDLDLEKILPRA